MPNPSNLYICPRCGYSTTQRWMMKRHFLQSVNPCPGTSGITLNPDIIKNVLLNHVYVPETENQVLPQSTHNAFSTVNQTFNNTHNMANINVENNTTNDSTTNTVDEDSTTNDSTNNSSYRARKSIPKALRKRVWITYIGEIFKGNCFCCKSNTIDSFDFHCGHIVAHVNGGQMTLENLRPICITCNNSMGTENLLEFQSRLHHSQ